MTKKERIWEALNTLDLVLDGLSALELLFAGLAEQHLFELSGAVSFVVNAAREQTEQVQKLLDEEKNDVQTEPKDM